MAEKILLVNVDMMQDRRWSLDDIAYEMRELVQACGGKVVDEVAFKLQEPSSATLISKGHVEDIAEHVGMHAVDTVILSCDLKGSQQRNLEEIFTVKTIDRTQLILDIFARHATSKEGKMQVELAQLEYLLPRLVGKGIALSRLGGGIGTLGPGETKLETDRRHIGRRITKLKQDLKDVVTNRQLKRQRRQKRVVPSISLVGYTNAGKSTLLNTLTGAEQVTKDGLFTTLDSLSRLCVLPNHQKVVFSDTVGFMHALPHGLIEAFKATLEEVQQADLLLHVVDISHANYKNYMQSVHEVLTELSVLDKPTITVFNKMDLVEDPSWLESAAAQAGEALVISAKTGQNVDRLYEQIMAMLSSLVIEVDIILPHGRMDLISLAHKEGEVYAEEYTDEGVHLKALIPAAIAAKFQIEENSS